MLKGTDGVLGNVTAIGVVLVDCVPFTVIVAEKVRLATLAENPASGPTVTPGLNV